VREGVRGSGGWGWGRGRSGSGWKRRGGGRSVADGGGRFGGGWKVVVMGSSTSTFHYFLWY